jgi:hypothetical protein
MAAPSAEIASAEGGCIYIVFSISNALDRGTTFWHLAFWESYLAFLPSGITAMAFSVRTAAFNLGT